MTREQFLGALEQRHGMGRWKLLKLEGYKELLNEIFGKDETILGDYSYEESENRFESTIAYVLTDARLLGIDMSRQELLYDAVPINQIEHVSVKANYKGFFREDRLIERDSIPSTVSIYLATTDWTFPNPLELSTKFDDHENMRKLLNEFINALNEALSR